MNKPEILLKLKDTEIALLRKRDEIREAKCTCDDDEDEDGKDEDDAAYYDDGEDDEGDD